LVPLFWANDDVISAPASNETVNDVPVSRARRQHGKRYQEDGEPSHGMTIASQDAERNPKHPRGSSLPPSIASEAPEGKGELASYYQTKKNTLDG